MVKKLLSFSLLLLGLKGYCQYPDGFYLHVGANQFNLKSDDISSKPGLGYFYGLGIVFGDNDLYDFTFEASQAHNTLELTYLDVNGTNPMHGDFTNVTTNLSFQFNYYLIEPLKNNFYLGLTVGPEVAFGNGKWSTKNTIDTDEIYFDTADGLQNPDFDSFSKINWGAGLGVVSGYGGLRAQLKFSKGFSNALKGGGQIIYDESGYSGNMDLKGKTDYLSLTVFYRIFK